MSPNIRTHGFLIRSLCVLLCPGFGGVAVRHLVGQSQTIILDRYKTLQSSDDLGFFLTGLFCLAEIWGLGFRAWGFQGAGVGFVAAEAGSPQGIHVEPCSQEVGRSGGGVSEVDIDTTTHDSKTSMYSRSI